MIRQYLVTIDGGSESNYASVVHDALENNGLPWYLHVGSVVRYDPDNFAALGKIGAIKRIRALLDVPLIDAKFLADTAQSLGTAKWGGVVVNCMGGETYTVADNRP